MNLTNSLNPFKPQMVGFMSVDVSRQYHQDLSQLKFLTAIPNGRLALDLNHNITQSVKRTTDETDEKITLLLKFLIDNSSHVNTKVNFMFITYRRTLISVMCHVFGGSEPLSIIASLFNGCIYLASVESPQETQRRQSRTKQEEKFCAWGYKFEQYLLSDLPSLPPDIERPVIENEEFSIYYRSVLGDHELFYGAQIDGLLATDGMVSDPPKTGDTEANLSYLRNKCFVELKTNREIQFGKQEKNFKRHKLLRCWCQCYLAGLKGLLVGFRDDSGIIRRLQWFDTEEIAAYCKNEWNPQAALGFLNYFLSFVKTCFRNNLQEARRKNYDLNNIGPITLRFEIDVDKTIRASKNVFESELILPDWYVNAFKQ